MISDQALLKAYRQAVHDERSLPASAAFATLYRRHGARLALYARSLGCSPEEAEDLVQRTFLCLLSARPLVLESAWPYLRKVLRRERHRCYRREALRPEPGWQVPPPLPPDRAAQRGLALDRLRRFLAVPEGRFVILPRWLLQGQDFESIRQSLGWERVRFRKRKSREILLLRQFLWEYRDASEDREPWRRVNAS